MTDETAAPSAGFKPPLGVELKDPGVDIEHILPDLFTFVQMAGLVHSALFHVPLVITSGRDGNHVASSKHAQGKAVDLRVSDLQPQSVPAWLLCLRVLAERYKLAVFDESYAPGMGHIHVEIAG